MTDTDAARALIAALRTRGWTVGTAESLTAGLVSARLADVPGCSDVLRGGVIAYAAQVKSDLLGAEAAAHGTVTREVARQMAQGIRAALPCDVGIATTGVAGPEPHDGQPVGSVWVAVATPEGCVERHLDLGARGRAEVREAAVHEALALARELLPAGE
mgnify:CR=1 FL=1